MRIQIHIGGGGGGGFFPEVNKADLAIGHANQHKPAATEISGSRMHYGKGKPGGNRRVHRISPRAHDFHPRSGAQLVHTDHHGVGGTNRMRGRPDWNRDRDCQEQKDH